MKQAQTYAKPTKQEQLIAKESYSVYVNTMSHLEHKTIELKISETKEKIVLPRRVLSMLEDILKAMSEGKAISVVPIETELTTQKAAEILGCSRPHLVKLLNEGKIPFNKIGKHRRIRIEDLMSFHKTMKDKQRNNLIKLMKHDEEAGLYDT